MFSRCEDFGASEEVLDFRLRIPYKLNLKTGKVEGRWISRAELEAEKDPKIAQLCVTHWFTGDGRYLGTTVEIIRYNPRIFLRYGWFRMKIRP